MLDVCVRVAVSDASKAAAHRAADQLRALLEEYGASGKVIIQEETDSSAWAVSVATGEECGSRFRRTRRPDR